MATVTPDTRPVPVAALLKDQEATIKGLAELLSAMADEPSGKARDAGEPWVTVDTTRSHRVVMLSGKRGSGKTSLLLTLQHEWARARGGEKTVDWAHQLAERALLLPSVDFDPLPPGVPMVDWIIGAFRPVAEWVDGRAGGKDHLKRWQEVSRCASVGWGAEASAGHRDLTESVYDREEQLKRWREVPRAWEQFVDHLCDALTSKGPGRGTPLLVLPIDDCDLQVARVHEVLHAVRLLHHPRVAFILTGDIEHAEDMERLHAWGEMRSVAGTEGYGDNEVEMELWREPAEWAHWLARSRVEKAVPAGHLLDVRLLSLADALDWHGGWMRKRLATVKPDDDWRGAFGQPANLTEYLLALPDGFRRELVRVRALVQLSADRAAERSAADGEGLVIDDLLYLVQEARGDDSSPGRLPVLRVRSRAVASFGEPRRSPSVVAVATRPRYFRKRQGASDNWTVVDSTDVLRHSIAAFKGEDAPDFWWGPQVAWTYWQDRDVAALLVWPLPIRPRSVPECHMLYQTWRVLCGAGVTSPQEVAYAFVRLCVWLVDGRLPAAGGGVPGLAEWRLLIDDLMTRANTGNGVEPAAFRDICQVSLPLLATPERGLPVEVREVILVHTVGRLGYAAGAGWSDRLNTWRQRTVVEGLSLAAQFRADALPRGVDSAPAAPSQTVAPDLALRLITAGDRDPWALLVRSEPWIGSGANGLSNLWQRLARGGRNGRGSLDAAILSLRTNPWGVQKLHELLLNGRPSRWMAELEGLVAHSEASPAEFGGALWRAFLQASRGWDDGLGANRVIRSPRFPQGSLGWADIEVLTVIRDEPPDDPSEVGPDDGGGYSEGEFGFVTVPGWRVDGLAGRCGPYPEQGVAALLLLIQSVLADQEAALGELSMEPLWRITLVGAVGLEVPPPRLSAWIDLDLLFRDVRLLRLVDARLPPAEDPSARRRWAAVELLQCVSRRALKKRFDPRIRAYEVTTDRIGGEIHAAVYSGMTNSPPFKAWWQEHRGKFIEWIGLNAGEVLPAGLASDPDPEDFPGIPTIVDPT